jgi:GDP-L-fucose synthase
VDLRKHRILVTGGAGFLGSHLVDNLRCHGCTDVIVPRSREYDLREKSAVDALFSRFSPEVVFHLAAVVGGIGANQRNPGAYFYENAIMGIHVIDAARRYGVQKIVVTGTICSYPKFTPVPFREENLWNGYPEETNAPYGIAKKALLVQAQAYRAQYGLNAVFLMPVNLYGPRDNFSLDTGHVIPNLIRKCLDVRHAREQTITLWGDGSPTREFLFVVDAAQALRLAAERYDGAEPVNLGSGQEISIRDLATLISSETGFDGRIVWDTSKPNGQPKRRLDTQRAFERFGFRAHCDLCQGIRQTVEWYRAHTHELKAA